MAVVPGETQPLRVLVTDDDEFTREVVREQLLLAGAEEVLEARDGPSALSIVDDPHTCPHLILADLTLPGMHGVALVRELSKRKFGGAVAVMSGSSPDVLVLVDDLATAMGLNWLGGFVKPLDANAIRELVRAARLFGGPPTI